MSDKRLRDCDILQLVDEGNKSDLSDFSEGEDEQFDFPSDEFDNLLHEYKLFGIDDAVNTEESMQSINNNIFPLTLYDISQENNVSPANITSSPQIHINYRTVLPGFPKKNIKIINLIYII